MRTVPTVFFSERSKIKCYITSFQSSNFTKGEKYDSEHILHVSENKQISFGWADKRSSLFSRFNVLMKVGKKIISVVAAI